MCALQSKRLVKTVAHVYENVPFYKKKIDDMGLEVGDIRGIEDLNKLPFTTKQDLRDNYPYGMFAVPMKQVVRVHASSGTTGQPTVVGYTQNDLDMWANCMARVLAGMGATDEDIVHNALGYGFFTGGLGFHYGSEKLGATIVPISSGNTKKQVQIMREFESTVLVTTPSYALYMGEYLRNLGIDPRELKLRIGALGGEPWSYEMRGQIEESLGIKAYDSYGMSEIVGPGVGFECTHKNHVHLNEDHFIPEIVDPETLEVLPMGATGEIVFTTVTKEAMPLLRYRTRDITSLVEGPCSCGRTTVRMRKCTGRSDDMLIIRGVNVFPSQIESVLLNLGETAPHYMLIVDRVSNLDTLEVWVEGKEGITFVDGMRHMKEIEKRITAEIHSVLGLQVKVKLVEPKSIERSEGKAKRIIDKRRN
ncbi:phenylacetate--CoA ligase [Niameybacter massiliensis]|uniref:Phenylacetate-coenzyme A ligase n=2 Tax=Holtiella tumoricola TaxID=3018743 RepID=A0AA42DLN2_9FIRM|nr:phenylacetate--CoA ligase [Holtiella tumoricola]MDA3731168.1 phenylacetate--CoA ligase [Holtiella tumoricola]